MTARFTLAELHARLGDILTTSAAAATAPVRLVDHRVEVELAPEADAPVTSVHVEQDGQDGWTVILGGER